MGLATKPASFAAMLALAGLLLTGCSPSAPAANPTPSTPAAAANATPVEVENKSQVAEEAKTTARATPVPKSTPIPDKPKAPDVLVNTESNTMTVAVPDGPVTFTVEPAGKGWPATAKGVIGASIETDNCQSRWAIDLGFKLGGRPAAAGLGCEDAAGTSQIALISIPVDLFLELRAAEPDLAEGERP